MTPVQQLRAARALLAPEGAWLPGYSSGAVDASGGSCPVRSPDAVRWGVLAALVRLAGPHDERLRAVDLVRRAVGAKHLHAWEQHPARTRAEVLDALDRAVALGVEGEHP